MDTIKDCVMRMMRDAHGRVMRMDTIKDRVMRIYPRVSGASKLTCNGLHGYNCKAYTYIHIDADAREGAEQRSEEAEAETDCGLREAEANTMRNMYNLLEEREDERRRLEEELREMKSERMAAVEELHQEKLRLRELLLERKMYVTHMFLWVCMYACMHVRERERETACQREREREREKKRCSDCTCCYLRESGTFPICR